MEEAENLPGTCGGSPVTSFGITFNCNTQKIGALRRVPYVSRTPLTLCLLLC